MCGIAGVVGRSEAGPDRNAAVGTMLGAMEHRGPDARGSLDLGSPDGRGLVGRVGAVRLAILDPGPAGNQPLRDDASGAAAVLNGEIYNHRELRAELPPHPWRSGCDTETLLRAWLEWGPGCLERLRGMFAFAVWDPGSAALWLARDRLGIKPLYIVEAPWGVAFASEARALVASGLVPAAVDSEGFASYLRFGSVQGPRTLFEGIASVPPGSWVRLREGGVEARGRYWSAADAPHAPDGKDPVRSTRAALVSAVEEHLLSDVPTACFLSRGIDSTLIAAIAARQRGARPVAFTMGLEGPEEDEVAVAAATARTLGLEHRAVRLTPEEALVQVEEAVDAQDLPSADGVNTYLLAGAVARAGFKVVLSGLGGDELFGGYPTFRRLARLARWGPWAARTPALARRAAAGWGERGERAVEATPREGSLAERYEALRAFWSRRALERFGLEPPAVALDPPEEGGLPLGARVSLLELRGYMCNTLLRDADVMSMAHSVELRVPFLDHRLVEHCLRVDAAGRPHPKQLLLEACGDFLPPGVAGRPKQGFLIGMDAWLRGPLRAYAADGVRRVAEKGVLPRLSTDTLFRAFDRRRLAWTRLWQLAVLGHWLHRWA